MYTAINSARSSKNQLRSKGIELALLPFLISRSNTEQDLNLKGKFISDKSERLEFKLKRVEIILSILNFIVLMLAIAETNAIYKDFEGDVRLVGFVKLHDILLKLQINHSKSLSTPVLRAWISTLVVVLIILVSVRYNLILNIAILNKRMATTSTIFNSKLLKNFLVETAIQIIHTPPGLFSYFVSKEQSNSEAMPINAVILVIMYTRLFYVWRLITVISRYETQISRDICDSQFVEKRRIFFVKIKMKESIILFYIIFSAISIIAFGSIIAIAERSYRSTSARRSITGYPDGFWVVFQILTTVGFGDLVPLTYFGRAVVVVLLIWTITSQYLSKVLYEIVQMDNNQLKCLKTFKVEEMKLNCVKSAAKAIKLAARFNHILNNPINRSQNDLISTYKDLFDSLHKFKMFRKELQIRDLESTNIVDLIRKFQYQVGKIADMRSSQLITKAGKLFSRTTKLARDYRSILEKSRLVEQRNLFTLKFLKDTAIHKQVASSNPFQDTNLKSFTISFDLKNQLPLMALLVTSAQSMGIRTNIKKITKILNRKKSSGRKLSPKRIPLNTEPNSPSASDSIQIQTASFATSGLENHINELEMDEILEKLPSQSIRFPNATLRTKEALHERMAKAHEFGHRAEERIDFTPSDYITINKIKRKRTNKSSNSSIASSDRSPRNIKFVEGSPSSEASSYLHSPPRTPLLMAIIGKRNDGSKKNPQSLREFEDHVGEYMSQKTTGDRDFNLRKMIDKYQKNKNQQKAISNYAFNSNMISNGFIDELDPKHAEKKFGGGSFLSWENEDLEALGKENEDLNQQNDESEDDDDDDEDGSDFSSKQENFGTEQIEFITNMYQALMEVIVEVDNEDHDDEVQLEMEKSDDSSFSVINEQDNPASTMNYGMFREQVPGVKSGVIELVKTKNIKNQNDKNFKRIKLKERAQAKLVKIYEVKHDDEKD